MRSKSGVLRLSKFIYIVGPAGSGKSTLAAALDNIMSAHGLNVICVNLDPGAEWLPYSPDVDIRDYVVLHEIMDRYKLGPNGGLIMAVDLSINYVGELKKQIEEIEPDYVLVDTPGQMELFAFRETGSAIMRSLGEISVMLFLIDSFFASRPSTFASALFLSLSTQLRFMMPQINVLSKVDQLREEHIEKIMGWLENLEDLTDALEAEAEASGISQSVSRELLALVGRVGFLGGALPVSATKGDGLIELLGEVQRTFRSEDEVELGYEE